ncbi:hypothetical protein [Brevundimonas poindexterae]|uniref:hypothetical protein n=1 Tax=Brevundimonas poindexterae TaxID=74325 RepID=UPI001CFCDAC5|nr:hypothetical protein [Brevundimonas poindexterae]
MMRVQAIARGMPVRLALTTAIAACLGVAACSQGSDQPAPQADAAEAAAPSTDGSGMARPASDSPAPVAASDSSAPAYARAYPGAEILPAGDAAETDLGGSVRFTTTDSPEAVIDFYQSRARDSGLSTVSALKQGEAQAYAAVDPEGRGATLQVVAQPAEGDADQTQVSVTWTVAQ